jgi:hypothetical protein
MQVNNKKALIALADFLEATSNDKPLNENSRKIMVMLVVPCINEEYAFGEWIMRGEVFFRGIKMEDVYSHNYNGKAMAKLLRYIVKNEKFPRNKSLTYK